MKNESMSVVLHYSGNSGQLETIVEYCAQLGQGMDNMHEITYHIQQNIRVENSCGFCDSSPNHECFTTNS